MIQVKRSPAKRVWFAVLILVLAVLFIETRNKVPNESNLLINAREELAGAKVFIDDKERGTLMSDKDADSAQVYFRGKVGAGEHNLKIVKDGWMPFTKSFKISSEAFISVEMDPQTK